jgi:hypothetical protein
MGVFPPFLWSTRQEDEDPHAKLVRLYAEAVAIDDLYLGVEEARYLSTPRPPTQQQQEQPLVSDAAREAINLFCRVRSLPFSLLISSVQESSYDVLFSN